MVLEQIHTSDSWEGGVPSPKLPSTSQLESYVHDLNIYYAIMQIYHEGYINIHSIYRGWL